jgi:hypothetical protein
MEESGQLHVPADLPSEKEPPCTHWIGGWVGSSVGLEAVEKRKILPLLGIKSGSSTPCLVTIPTDLSRLHTVHIQSVFQS